MNFMKQERKYGDESIMVVLDSEGTITNLNALDMVFIWGSEAYPFSLSRENELWDGEHWTMQLMTNEIHPILTQWVEEGRNICIYGSENLDWIREFSAKMKEIKDAGVQLEMIYVGKNNPNEHVKDNLITISREMHSNLLSFTKVQFFWLRLESMRRSKSRLGNTASTDHILAGVLTLLYNNDDNGWAVFGKGFSTDIVRVQGGEIIQCLNLFRQWGENVAQLEFIGALRTVLEPPLLDGPCNHTEFIPYSEGLIEGSIMAEGKHLCLYGGEDMDWIRKFTTKARDVAKAAEKLSDVLPDLTLIWFFWLRLESMWHSKVQQGSTVEVDPIMPEIVRMLSFGSRYQGWAVISRGSAEMARAIGEIIFKSLEEYSKWNEQVVLEGFIATLFDHIYELRT
ncbi:hypothetical protein CRYUN_Cryun21dG0059600 [Craigia yunnanensis]